jgi:hypothetical protein
LLRIIEPEGGVGFIDTIGNVRVSPTFIEAEEFSEGLAVARTSGVFGYIDHTGKFAIPPQFDWAFPFSNGFARVFIDGKTHIINTKGELVFENTDYTIVGFENGVSAIYTKDNKMGYINTQGKLIIDTVFADIAYLPEGLAIVATHKEYMTFDKIRQIGIVDTTGRFIVPLGVYTDIAYPFNGYFAVQLNDRDAKGYVTEGFVNTKGELIVSKNTKEGIHLGDKLACERIKVLLEIPSTANDRSYYDNDLYTSFIDMKGNICIADTTYEINHDFADNRVFAQTKQDTYCLIDRNGRKISNDEYTGVAGDGFKDGVAFVKKDDKYGMIDTTGKFLIPPKFQTICPIGLVNQQYFFYGDYLEDGMYDGNETYGIACKDGSVLLKPCINPDYFDMAGFHNGILKAVIDYKLSYINQQGKIIWQEKYDPITAKKMRPLHNLNIAFMNRGYFYAISRQLEEGFRKEHLAFSQKTTNSHHFSKNMLSVVVRPDLKDTIEDNINAITVFVANTTDKAIAFGTQDNRLYMKVQAKNRQGEWKDIEHLPGSWCGNSYYDIQLPENHYWQFTTPVYEGDFATKLRIAVEYKEYSEPAPAKKKPRPKKKKNKHTIYNYYPTETEQKKQEKIITIYSNEYDGSINPGQWYRKTDYRPHDIMIP